MKLGGKNDNKLYIITAYHVVQEKGTHKNMQLIILEGSSLMWTLLHDD